MIGNLRTSPCRGCGKEIAFIKTEKGKTMPVNPEEVCFIPGGGPNTYVLPGGRVVRGSEARNSDENTVMGYISHFATCPERDNMRKK